MNERAQLDPYGFTLAQSPGVQAGMALAMPGYGEAMSGFQIYSGIQTENNTQIVLGGAGLLLSGYSSYNFYRNGGYAGSLTSSVESRFVPVTEAPIVQAAAPAEATSVNVGVGTKISLSVEEAAVVNPTYAAGEVVNNVDDFIAGQTNRLYEKLGAKIGKGELPFTKGKQGVLDAIESVRTTLSNPSQISGVIPKSSLRGNYDLIHIYSSKSGNTVSLRVLENGKYEFDTLIFGKSSKF